LIKGLLPQRQFAMVYGATGSAKTFFAIEAALCVGAGRPFLGMKTTPGAVAYIATENPSSVERRIAAVRDHLKIRRAEVALVDGGLNLTDPASVERLMDRLSDVARRAGELSLVIIDTAAQAMPGADENSFKDMGAFVDACLRIRDELETSVLVVHHSGKSESKGARGHSSLRAAVDVELEISDDQGVRVVTVTKVRDGETGRRFGFKLRPIPLGPNEDGEMLTTCAVEPAPVPTKKATNAKGGKPRQPSGSNQKLALKSLQNAQHQHGRSSPDVPAGIRAVTHDQWQETFARENPRINGGHRASKFQSAVNGLRANGFVDSQDDLYWAVDENKHRSRSDREVTAQGETPECASPNSAHQIDALGDSGDAASTDSTERGGFGDNGDLGETGQPNAQAGPLDPPPTVH